MKFCTRCLYSDIHPLHLTFDDDGVCSGCRVHEEKDIIDWAERLDRLRSIVNGYKNLSGNNYDCIVPVSGARDSFFIVHTVKNVLGLNPLLVTYNKQYNTDLGIRNLAHLRITFDCDIMTQTVNPHTVKKITRATLRKMGSMYWHCLAGQTVFPVQIAVKFKIPLIIWGAHQGIDQVGMFSHYDEVEMTRKYRKEHDLMGFEAEDLVDEFDHIKQDDIHQYMYPDDREIEAVGVRGIYLNNYIRWDTKAQHEKMLSLYGYETAEQTRTFDAYNDADCFNYSDVHDYLKYIKYGYGKVVDHAVREIRLRRMTREQGIDFIRKFVKKQPKHLAKFLQWVGITESGFNFVVDQHRNKHVWERDEHWQWRNIRPIVPQKASEKAEVITRSRLEPSEEWKDFILTDNKRPNYRDNTYILIGKGYY